MKLLTYLLLTQGCSASFKQNLAMKKGHCPYKAGDIKVDMVAKVEAELLQGSWINIYDRKHLNDHVKCVSVAFEDYQSDDEGKYPAYSILNISKKTAVVDGAAESYNIREGMQINFGYGKTEAEKLDNSIGMIENQHWGDYDLEEHGLEREFHHDGTKEKDFDPFLWDSQYQRYA